MIFVRKRRAKERHDPVAHDLIDCPLVAVHRFHHVFEDRIEKFPRFLRITVSKQLHRSFHISEEHCDLLALAFEGAFRRKDLLGEMFGSISFGRNKACCYGGLRTHRLPALKTELGTGRELRATRGAF